MEAILYIPAAGDPYRVMASGVCGAHPPRVHLWGRPPTWRPGAGRGERSLSTHALPLVWGGEVVPESEHRLIDRLNANTAATLAPAPWVRARNYAIDEAPDVLTGMARVSWALAAVAARELGGSVVVL